MDDKMISNEREDDFASIRKMYDDLQWRLQEKEDIVKLLKTANESIRVNYDINLKKLERETGEVVKALEDANIKDLEQQQKITALKEEIEGLKGVLSFSQQKCSEAEETIRATVELRKGGDMLLTSKEEESTKIKDQLKWKQEQFKHLEDAHEKLREQFHVNKNDWDAEKSMLLDELCRLQRSLESQTRISEDLRNQLKMCNQAMAHEESRMRSLESQLAESKRCIESAFTECDEAKSKVESLTIQKDKEIANLRSSLSSKGTLYKDMEYRVVKLEEENRDLLESLKELREAQIREAGSFSSLGKLKSRLKNLEQVHRGCSENLKTKEEEWRRQMEKLSENLNGCISELNGKYIVIEELKRELDDCHSHIMKLNLQNEESSLMLLVLKSEFSKAILELNADKEQQISCLLTQMELKNLRIEEESKKSASLQRKLEELDANETNQNLLLQELERHKEMLEGALKMESQFEEKLKEVGDAFDAANSELSERICEGNEMEFELEIWRNVAEGLKVELEEKNSKCRLIEASLLAQVEVEETLKQDKDGLIQMVGEKDDRIGFLQQQIALLNQETEKTTTETRKIEALQMITTAEGLEEIEDKNAIVAELNSDICSLKEKVALLEETSSCLRQELEMEIDDKNAVIVELQDNICSMKHKMELLEETLTNSRQKLEKIRADLGEKQSEVEELAYQLEKKLRVSDASIDKLEDERRSLLREREELLGLVSDMFDGIGRHSSEGMHLVEMLKTITESCSPNEASGRLRKENAGAYGSPAARKPAAIPWPRSPFRELNE